ncbi:MAG: ankyrin repeat domain-containing protein [Alcanivorax sp.]|nr:ankyrin repeat domain-containing protein [Alcanivorax sp.]
METLVQYGFDVNHMSYSGVTPLRNASGMGQYEIALWLLENGADPTLKDGPSPQSTSVLDFVKRFGGRGENIWSRRKLNAYNEFIDALIERGYLDELPSHNGS